MSFFLLYSTQDIQPRLMVSIYEYYLKACQTLHSQSPDAFRSIWSSSVASVGDRTSIIVTVAPCEYYSMTTTVLHNYEYYSTEMFALSYDTCSKSLCILVTC